MDTGANFDIFFGIRLGVGGLILGPFARIPQDPATDSELLVGALVARISVFWRDVLSGFQGSRTVFCVGVLGVPRLPPGGGAAAKRRLHRFMSRYRPVNPPGHGNRDIRHGNRDI